MFFFSALAANSCKTYAKEPQVLYNRKQPVAALIDMEEYEAFLEYKKTKQKPTMAELLAELDEIKKQEPGDFELPPNDSPFTKRPEPSKLPLWHGASQTPSNVVKSTTGPVTR